MLCDFWDFSILKLAGGGLIFGFLISLEMSFLYSVELLIFAL